jgi:hypothetical protein
MKPGRGSGSFLVEFSSLFIIVLFAKPHHRSCYPVTYISVVLYIKSRTDPLDDARFFRKVPWGKKFLIAGYLYAQQTLDRWIVETHSVERSNQKSYTSIPAIDHPASPYLGQALRPELRFRKCIPPSWTVKGKGNLITTSCCSAITVLSVIFPLFFPC